MITKDQYEAHKAILEYLENIAYSFLSCLRPVLSNAKYGDHLGIKSVRICEKGYHENNHEYIHIEIEEDYSSDPETFDIFLPIDALFAEDQGQSIIDNTIKYLLDQQILKVLQKDLKDKKEREERDLKELARLKSLYPDA